MAYNQTQKCITILLMMICLFEVTDYSAAEWLNHGANLSNRRSAIGEVLINPLSIKNLHLRWTFHAGRDISATPALANGVVYFPSWNGYLYAVNAINGALIWKQNLSDLTGLTSTGIVANVNVTVSRSTPTVDGNLLIVGIYGPAVVIAVNRLNGRLVWSRQLDPCPRALITMSGTIYLGSFYVGISSLEEALPADKCCTFPGSLVKLDVRTGAIRWQTFMLPDNGGKLGGINFNSIVALDIDSGRISWAKQLGGYDVFHFACLVPDNPDCPPGPNLDADFGEAPMLLTIYANGTIRDVVVAVQKRGFAWALNRDNGEIVWFKLAGPGGEEGGGQWGAATDGRRVYTNIANSNRVNFTLAPSRQTTTAGAWVALDAYTGEILWSTANPSNDTAQAPVTVVNGLLFAGSVAPNGPIYAMDTNTGRILWSYNTGSTVYGGISASYGCIYLGNGYTVGLAARFHPTWTPGTSLYAFCIV
ncbi:hypothetical protein Q3G72_017148 [Acer saccharum]|nr:hypothetical protein Q3G72_017148 [Acer saccharum]